MLTFCDIGVRLSLYLSFVSCSYPYKADARKDVIVIVRHIEEVLLTALMIAILMSIVDNLCFVSITRRSEKPIDSLVPILPHLVDKCKQ